MGAHNNHLPVEVPYFARFIHGSGSHKIPTRVPGAIPGSVAVTFQGQDASPLCEVPDANRCISARRDQFRSAVENTMQ